MSDSVSKELSQVPERPKQLSVDVPLTMDGSVSYHLPVVVGLLRKKYRCDYPVCTPAINRVRYNSSPCVTAQPVINLSKRKLRKREMEERKREATERIL